MKKNMNSAFTKLAVSYVTIVFVVVLLLCSIFYMYFPKNYNEEIKNKNQMVLESAVSDIESSVFQRVQQIYMDLSLGGSVSAELLANDSLQGKHGSVMDIQDLLKNEVADHTDIVSAVHLFYPKPQVMISSDYGLRYLEGQSEGAGTAMSWIDQLRRSETSFVWTQTRLVPRDMYSSVSDDNGMIPLISYAHSYPVNSTGEDSELMIAIDIKETAISAIIQKIMPSGYASTFVMGPGGTIISAADKSLLGSSAAGSGSYIQTILSSGAEGGSFTDTIEDQSNEVSFYKFPSNNWRLYNITLTDNYYQKSIVLQKVVLLICLLTLIVGIVLSGVFTLAIYEPLRRLRDKIKGMFDHAPASGLSEYTLIDTAINRLTSKVSSLEETLELNSPVIKHNIVLNVLNNSYSREELAEQLQSVNISMAYSRFCCLLIDPASKAFKALHPTTVQYVIYRLINQLEAADSFGSRIIAEELPDSKIAVIVCADKAEEALLKQLSDYIITEVNSSFGLEFTISLGCWVQQFMDVHKSFAEATVLAKYGYILPEVFIINDRGLLDRDCSTLEIPQQILLKFRDKLLARSATGAAAALDHIIEHMREGLYSAEYCRFILLNTVSVYSDYLISVRYLPSDNVKMNLYNQYNAIHDIRSYREWLVQSITECMGQMEKRSDNRASDSIEAVKQYISSHLSEELSLDTVAGQVFISPKYLSKIFKEETGQTYTEYVTGKRMEKAMELMANRNMTIEQIAGTVGYGTAAYFIKKFKELNGDTPKNYRRQIMGQ